MKSKSVVEQPITRDDAASAVLKFEGMAYFQTVSVEVRESLVDILLMLVNGPCPMHPDAIEPCDCCDPRPAVRNHSGVTMAKPPIDRLNLFVSKFRRHPGGWPGIGEMEAIYCMLFAPGDGVERPSPTTPGFTYGDHESGTHTSLLPEAPGGRLEIEAQKYDDMTNEEGKKFAASLSVSLAHIAANSTDGVGE